MKFCSLKLPKLRCLTNLTLKLLPLTREHLVEATILMQATPDASLLNALCKRFQSSRMHRVSYCKTQRAARPFPLDKHYDGFPFSPKSIMPRTVFDQRAMILTVGLPSGCGRGTMHPHISPGRRTSTAGEEQPDFSGAQCVIVEGHSEGWVIYRFSLCVVEALGRRGHRLANSLLQPFQVPKRGVSCDTSLRAKHDDVARHSADCPCHCLNPQTLLE